MPIRVRIDETGGREALDVLLGGMVRDFGQERTRRKLLIPAMRPLGNRVNRRIRATTPVSRQSLKNRLHLADSVRGRIRTEPDGNISYYGGYLRGRRTGIRFQQVLAITYGARGRPGLEIIRRALAEEAGADGQRFRDNLVAQLVGRLNALILEAETKRDSRRLGRLRRARVRVEPHFQAAIRRTQPRR